MQGGWECALVFSLVSGAASGYSHTQRVDVSATKKVLIIDDDADFAESNRDLLEGCGYDVAVATDGAGGLALARALRPDVVILDVMMTTDTEGFDIARRIREAPDLRHTAVLLVTGIGRELKLRRPPTADGTWLPVDGVIEKPIAPKNLLAEIHRVLKART
jgi:CheY-like chemotaxis protein